MVRSRARGESYRVYVSEGNPFALEGGAGLGIELIVQPVVMVRPWKLPVAVP